MTIVDSHVHLLPRPVAKRVRELFDIHMPGQLVYPIDETALLDRVMAEGLSELWSLPYAHRPGVAEWLNQSTVALQDRVAAHPVRVVAGATVHPADQRPGDIVRRAVIELGARVLKLHCAVGDFDAGDPRLTPVWAACEAHRLPVVIHAGHAHTGHTQSRDANALETVAARHPAVPLIVAHAGHPATGFVIDLMERHENVHADLTPVVSEPVDLGTDEIGRFAGRLLFGSDAPNTGLTVTELLAGVSGSGLAPTDVAAITGGNAKRLATGVRLG